MTLLTVVFLSLAAASCGAAASQSRPQIVQPGAPGEASGVIGPASAVNLSRVGHTAADVNFMQGMIGHHAQAVEMTDLLATRTASDTMRKLGQRIQVSQADEIKMMQRWLEARGERAPGLMTIT